MPHAIGIDLGTSESVVAVWQNDRVEVISNDIGLRTTPSYVAFTTNERLIGIAAKNQASQNPENTIFDAKRLIGRIFSDQSTQNDIKHFPFKVIDQNMGIKQECLFFYYFFNIFSWFLFVFDVSLKRN